MTTIALCLLLGAIVNVLVAWACDRASNPFTMHYEWEPISAWPHAVPSYWPSPQGDAVGRSLWETYERIVSRRIAIENADGTIHGWYELTPDYRIGAVMYRSSVGIPFRSLESWSTRDDLKEVPAIKTSVGTFLVTLPWLGPHSLPYIPVWPGFAINTLMYALPTWLLWQLPALLRKHLRSRRGLCTHCGYVLVGISVEQPCPECGNARA